MATIYNPNEDENQENEQQGALTDPESSGPSQASTPVSPNVMAPQRQGSGRFTNIQKYLQANQQGGQQIASGIGQNIQSDISKQQEQAQDYYSKVGQGIQQAKQQTQAGSDYVQQLKGIGQNIQSATGADMYANRPQDLGIQQFTQQPGFQQFQNIQAGRGVNESQLAAQQADLAQAAQGYLGSSQEALQNLGSEGGRFNLLKQTFGGNVNPQYSTGQQRLDQLFLAQQGVQPLQQETRQQVKSAQELMRQAGQTGSQIGGLIGQEQKLMSDIGQQTTANEQAYIDMLSSYLPSINEQRQAEWQSLEDALSAYRPLAEGEEETQVVQPGLTSQQLQDLGVTQEYGAFDVLENLTGAADVATKGIDAQSYQDVATQDDVNRYAALAQIAGIDPNRLTQASDLGAAYTAREGDANLANRLSKAQGLFDELAADTRFSRWGGGKRGRSFGGKRRSYGGGAYANAADLMEQGEAAITKYLYGDNSGGWGRGNRETSARQVWDDFQNFLEDQKYGRTIGPDMGGPALYGSREIQKVPDRTIKLGAEDDEDLQTIPGKE